MFKRNINSIHGADSHGIVRWFHGTNAGSIQHKPHKTGQPFRPPAQPQGIMRETPSAAGLAPRLPKNTKIRNQPLTEPDRWTKDQAGNCVGSLMASGATRLKSRSARTIQERTPSVCGGGVNPAHPRRRTRWRRGLQRLYRRVRCWPASLQRNRLNAGTDGVAAVGDCHDRAI